MTASSRLVTLTGPAGCGKTRIALRAAGDVIHQYADGIRWLDLARLTDARLVPAAVARTLNVSEQPERSLLDGLVDSLLDKQLLLVLDNCEHLLSACGQLVDRLLAATSISILATSREPLGVTGERRYQVPPMALPAVGLPLRDLEQMDAVQLFVNRACAVLPDFTLTPDNSEAVASICRNLDGIPLAIELASARVNVLTTDQIAARLDDRFDLLAEAPHVTRSHHHTLRAAIDWSYDLLTYPEQVLLSRLSVFTGGCSLEGAESVCSGDMVGREQVLELLSSLVDKSLVAARTLLPGEARYSLLDTIRRYAQEKLVASGEWLSVHDIHIRYVLRLTEETALKLKGPYQQLWLNWLEAEYDNVRSALAWSAENERIEMGLRIAIALYQFWTVRDYVEEGLDWFERLLPKADETVSPTVHAKALAYAAFTAGFRGNTSAQLRYGRAAAALAETLGGDGKPALAFALAGLAHGLQAEGNYQAVLTIGQRVIQLHRELGDLDQLAVTLSVYSPAAMALGEYEVARAMLAESLALLREAGNEYRVAMALNYLGDLARCEQNHALAQSAYEESVSLLRELGAARDLASVLQNLGHAWLHLGDVERAHALFTESMITQQTQRNTPGIAECLIGFAAMAAACRLPTAAARLLSAATSIGGQRAGLAWPATRLEYEHYLALVQSDLSETEFEVEQAAGRVLSLEQAIEYAQGLPLKPAEKPASGEKPNDLTSREREVAELISKGKSNGEIADELVVSKRTVEKHIANILSKLRFTNRAQIVRWVIETDSLNRTG